MEGSNPRDGQTLRLGPFLEFVRGKLTDQHQQAQYMSL